MGIRKLEAVHVTKNPIACQLDEAQFWLAFPNDQTDAFAETVQTEYIPTVPTKTALTRTESPAKTNFMRDDPAKQMDKSGLNGGARWGRGPSFPP